MIHTILVTAVIIMSLLSLVFNILTFRNLRDIDNSIKNFYKKGEKS